jgi:hypothetical protein
MRWVGHVARMGEERCIQGLVGKPEGKTRLGRRRCRWEDSYYDGSSGSGMWGCGLD